MGHIPFVSHPAPAAFCLAVLGIIAVNCSKPEEFVYDDETDSGVTLTLPKGTVIGVYAVDADGNVTCSTAGVDGDGNAVLPTSGSASLTAYAPWQENWGLEAYLDPPVFSVKEDQNAEGAYAASDLIMGRLSGSDITLGHMLARVAVNIIDDIGLSDLSGTTVTLPDAYTSVSVDIPQCSVSTVEILRGDVTMSSVTASDWRLSCKAVVAPHSLDKGTPLISVALFGGNPQVFVLSEDAELAGGSTFTYNLRLTQQGLIPDSWSITDWDDGEEEDLEIHPQ